MCHTTLHIKDYKDLQKRKRGHLHFRSLLYEVGQRVYLQWVSLGVGKWTNGGCGQRRVMYNHGGSAPDGPSGGVSMYGCVARQILSTKRGGKISQFKKVSAYFATAERERG